VSALKSSFYGYYGAIGRESPACDYRHRYALSARRYEQGEAMPDAALARHPYGDFRNNSGSFAMFAAIRPVFLGPEDEGMMSVYSGCMAQHGYV
jgi:hypothetical protein